MALDITVCVGDDALIKLISDLHSPASSRDTINKNFQKLAKAIGCLTQFNIADLEGLNFPSTPSVGVFYNLVWNGTSWDIKESPSNYGIKYRLNAGDDIIVRTDYQYIVHNQLDLNGGSITLEAGGDLVIL